MAALALAGLALASIAHSHVHADAEHAPTPCAVCVHIDQVGTPAQPVAALLPLSAVIADLVPSLSAPRCADTRRVSRSRAPPQIPSLTAL
jgi:hypothetical protein